MERITYPLLPVARGEKVKMTVTMSVTAPQAYALMAMFNDWNSLANMGGSREIGFYVDGDGDFKPRCEIKTEPDLPRMPKEQMKIAIIRDEGGNRLYDFDPIGWSLRP